MSLPAGEQCHVGTSRVGSIEGARRHARVLCGRGEVLVLVAGLKFIYLTLSLRCATVLSRKINV